MNLVLPSSHQSSFAPFSSSSSHPLVLLHCSSSLPLYYVHLNSSLPYPPSPLLYIYRVLLLLCSHSTGPLVLLLFLPLANLSFPISPLLFLLSLIYPHPPPPLPHRFLFTPLFPLFLLTSLLFYSSSPLTVYNTLFVPVSFDLLLCSLCLHHSLFNCCILLTSSLPFAIIYSSNLNSSTS